MFCRNFAKIDFKKLFASRYQKRPNDFIFGKLYRKRPNGNPAFYFFAHFPFSPSSLLFLGNLILDLIVMSSRALESENPKFVLKIISR